MLSTEHQPLRHLRSGDHVQLVTDVVVHAPLRQGSVDLELRDEQGTLVFGATRGIEDDVEVGSVWQFRTDVALPLRAGRYTLSASVLERERSDLVDRYRDAVAFEITSLRGQVGLVELPNEQQWTQRFGDTSAVAEVLEAQLPEFTPHST